MSCVTVENHIDFQVFLNVSPRKNEENMVHKVGSKCEAYEFLKRNQKLYGKLPPIELETKPWDTLCVNLISKYQFTLKEEERNSKSY